jgi:hypothetical protein
LADLLHRLQELSQALCILGHAAGVKVGHHFEAKIDGAANALADEPKVRAFFLSFQLPFSRLLH